MIERREIEDFLRAEVEKATRHYEEAKLFFWRVSAEIPSGLPHPDGAQRIQIAARAQTYAMEELSAQLRKFNSFLIDGTIPDDLLKAPQESAAGGQTKTANSNRR
jgi:hypothetical protein